MTQPEPTQQQPQPAPAGPVAAPKRPNRSTRTIAKVWLVLSLLAGSGTMIGTRFETYGGDAYTGLQNAIARGNIALGWVIIGTGVLAFIVAHRS